MESYPLLKHYFTVYGEEEWNSRRRQRLHFNRGTYRLPFSILFPTRSDKGEQLPSSFERISERHSCSFNIRYHLSAILVRPFPLWNLHSKLSPVRLRAHPKVEEEAMSQGLQRSFSERTSKRFWFGGEVEMQVSLAKTAFCLGEKIKMVIEIDNRNSPHDVQAVTVDLKESIKGDNAKVVISRGSGYRKGLTKKKISSSQATSSLGKDVGKSRHYDIKVEKGHLNTWAIQYELDYRDMRGVSLFHSNFIEQSYSLYVGLKLPLGTQLQFLFSSLFFLLALLHLIY